MATRNPLLNPVLQRYGGPAPADRVSAGAADTAHEPVVVPEGERLRLDDVVVKSAILLATLVAGALLGWALVPVLGMWLWIAALIGMVLGFVNVLRSRVSPALMLVYGIVQGVFLGGISRTFQSAFGGEGVGLVANAVIGTVAAFVVVLVLYRLNVLRATNTFVKVITIAGFAYLGLALVSLVSGLFGVGGGWGFYGVGPFGILLAAAGVALASLFLVLDFNQIETGIRAGLPERESWRLAFGLTLTLVWLYIEMLRLFSLLSSNE